MSRIAGPIEVTESVLALHRHLDGKPPPSPYARHDAWGRKWTVAGRIFQGRMWREYAGAWAGIPIDRGNVGYPHGHRVILGRKWMESILRVSKDECIRRSRVNFYLARRYRREGERAAPPLP